MTTRSSSVRMPIGTILIALVVGVLLVSTLMAFGTTVQATLEQPSTTLRCDGLHTCDQ